MTVSWVDGPVFWVVVALVLAACALVLGTALYEDAARRREQRESRK